MNIAVGGVGTLPKPVSTIGIGRWNSTDTSTTSTTSASKRSASKGERRPMSKVVGSAKEAFDGVNFDGVTLCVGGFGLGGNPHILLDELSNKTNNTATTNAKDMIVVSLTGGTDGGGVGELIEAGLVQRLISSYVGENKYLEQAYFNGTLEVELTPQGTIAQRMRAAGSGIPAFFHQLVQGPCMPRVGYQSNSRMMRRCKWRSNHLHDQPKYLMDTNMLWNWP
jgi:Coenzyme A transferase